VKGDGYYHFHTREAYDVVLERVRNQILKKKGQKSSECACMVCFPCCIPCGLASRKRLSKEIKTLEDLCAIVEARKRAAGPQSALDIPVEMRQRFEKSDNRNDSSYGGGDVGYAGYAYYYESPGYLCDQGGGGCGGGTDG